MCFREIEIECDHTHLCMSAQCFSQHFSFLHFPLPLSHVKLFPPSAGSGSRLIYTPRFMSSYPRSPVRGTRFRVMMHSERSLFRYCFFFFIIALFLFFWKKNWEPFWISVVRLNICCIAPQTWSISFSCLNFLDNFRLPRLTLASYSRLFREFPNP